MLLDLRASSGCPATRTRVAPCRTLRDTTLATVSNHFCRVTVNMLDIPGGHLALLTRGYEHHHGQRGYDPDDIGHAQVHQLSLQNVTDVFRLNATMTKSPTSQYTQASITLIPTGHAQLGSDTPSSAHDRVPAVIWIRTMHRSICFFRNAMTIW
ncbi:hypothetical protein PBRA_007152 [Plasmodiophora brassicae]|uniref:Uncharacterized protein n=1 Tax=Plasmodiophora brassicae TaxID=37360 RepID=A0A0G4IV50_PLABS|nr:hypothetical protein PBRA_007152 [Plasmodiophora brassicae]